MKHVKLRNSCDIGFREREIPSSSNEFSYTILKELFANPKIEQREGQTKDHQNLLNKNSSGRLRLN